MRKKQERGKLTYQLLTPFPNLPRLVIYYKATRTWINPNPEEQRLVEKESKLPQLSLPEGILLPRKGKPENRHVSLPRILYGNSHQWGESRKVRIQEFHRVEKSISHKLQFEIPISMTESSY